MKKPRIETDIISQLPDELLIRILSLLPAADATRSCILSNRWKHLWAFLPNLYFVMPKFKEQANKFNDSVDQILALRGGMPIQKFFPQFSYYGNTTYLVNKWLRIVTQCKVEELDFRFGGSINDIYFWNCFRNKSSGVLVKPEVEIIFTCFKKLNLQRISCIDTNSLTNLLSRCPVLEELCVDRIRFSPKSCMAKISLMATETEARTTTEYCPLREQRATSDSTALTGLKRIL
ncbi:putative F-box/LRR-repeat protein At3g58880 [Rutidosis leptorrhynchoides]|uniref:putative F-box/LRR-repeat protein At3g58880 n=1 Tax=Rutidosis leptorrhynchoides TaxID=125765 RepID=UPI003A9A2DFD